MMAEHNEDMIRQAKKLIAAASEGLDAADVAFLKGNKPLASIKMIEAEQNVKDAIGVFKAIAKSMR